MDERREAKKRGDIKTLWEISEEVVVDYQYEPTHIGGGRGEEPKITWQEAYDILLKKIC